LLARSISGAGSGEFGVHLIRKVARAVGRVENIELGSEQPNLSTERTARLGAKRGQKVGFRCPEAFVETGEEFIALLGGDDSAGAPVGRIGASLDQAFGFEVVEEVGHDRTVYSEVLGESELATDRALSGRRKHLVAPGAAGKVGDCGMGGLDIGPKNHAQTPSEIICQPVCAAQGVLYLALASDVVHQPIIRAGPRSVAYKILCSYDDLYSI
jgi:hypothetical protein